MYRTVVENLVANLLAVDGSMSPEVEAANVAEDLVANLRTGSRVRLPVYHTVVENLVANLLAVHIAEELGRTVWL